MGILCCILMSTSDGSLALGVIIEGVIVDGSLVDIFETFVDLFVSEVLEVNGSGSSDSIKS